MLKVCQNPHNVEKLATAKQAFPFHACFNEQNFCEAEKKALQERFCKLSD